MLDYVAKLQQDGVDYGFESAHGAHSVLLVAMEECRCSCDDSKGINNIRKSYVSKSVISNGNASSSNSYSYTTSKSNNCSNSRNN